MPFCSFSEGAAMFDATPIENMFLLEYLPTAPEGFLRVYLYARMLCLHPELGGEIGDVAKALRMEEDAVFNAFSYWERQGLVERLTDRPPTYAIRPLRNGAAQPAMERDYYTYREFNASMQDMFGPEQLLQPNQYKMANDWLNVLGFEQAAALKILEYERRQGGKPAAVFKRADKRAADWADRGIRSLEDVERAIAYDGQVYAMAAMVMKQFSMNRKPTVNELDCVRRWVGEWKLTEEDVLAACALTTKSRAPSIAYLDAILRAKVESGSDEKFDRVKELLRELGSIKAMPTPEQTKKYAQWMEQGFEPETIRLAAVQCARKRKNSFEDLEWMVEKWGEAGLYSSARAESYVAEMQQATAEVRRLLELAGLARRPNMDDLKRYEGWKLRFAPELMEYAAECARGTKVPVRYMEKLLTEWEKKNISSVDAAKAEHARAMAGGAEKSSGGPVNFQQRSYSEEDLRDIYFDPMKEYAKEGDGQ